MTKPPNAADNRTPEAPGDRCQRCLRSKSSHIGVELYCEDDATHIYGNCRYIAPSPTRKYVGLDLEPFESSDHEGKVREAFAKFRQGHMKDDWPVLNTSRLDEFIGDIDLFLASECKAAVASALAQVGDKLDRVADGYFVGGHSHRAQMLHALAIETRALSPDSGYIALREAEARIAEAERMPHLYGECLAFNHDRSITGLECSCYRGKRIAALTEARDRIAKGTK